MWVFAHLDGEAERVLTSRAEGWREEPAADLNTIAVACAADGSTLLLPRLPGLPDDAFTHDGQLTKREVRAATLAALAPLPGGLLWDVGAGCGSVAIEWMRAARGARALAVERDAARQALIAGNAAALGVPELVIVAGAAPAALNGLDAPDAVFIGGGIAADGAALFERCWRALPSGGRLVANVVTVEGEAALARWHAEIGGNLTRIAIARTAPMGRLTGWRPFRAVTQFAVVKP